MKTLEKIIIDNIESLKHLQRLYGLHASQKYENKIDILFSILEEYEEQKTIFKVGDKVRVKSWDQLLNESMGQDAENNIIMGHDQLFEWQNIRYCNKEYTITRKNSFGEYTLTNENKEKILLESFAFELIQD